MTENQELDAEIARQVFCHTVYLVNIGSAKRPRMAYSYDEHPRTYDDQGSLEYDEHDFVPQYSTDMGEAWKMAEYLAGNDPRVTILSFKLEYCGYRKWFKAMFENFDEGIVHTGSNTSPAMAICLAALEKVRQDRLYAESKKNA